GSGWCSRGGYARGSELATRRCCFCYGRVWICKSVVRIPLCVVLPCKELGNCVREAVLVELAREVARGARELGGAQLRLRPVLVQHEHGRRSRRVGDRRSRDE